jgi:undecaprenyl-diphosphatase
MQLGALPAVGVVAACALLGRRFRLAQGLLVAGGLAWAAARLLQYAVDQPSPEVVLKGVVLHGAVVPGLAFPASHAAVAAALATAAAPYVSRRTRHLLWALAVLVAVARVYNGAHFPIDVVGGLALGWGIGSLVHLILGAPRGLPRAEEIARLLDDAGHPVERVRRVRAPASAAVAFRASSTQGDELHVTFVGRDAPEAGWLYRAGRLLAFRELEDEAAASTPGHRVAREAYITMLAERAGVRVAPLVAAVEAGSAATLIRAWVPGTPLLPDAPCVNSDMLRELFCEVGRLHAAGLSHGALRGDHIVVGPAGPVLVGFALGRDGASVSEQTADIAELLVTASQVTDAATAVRIATEGLGQDRVAATLPSLQPLVLSSVTRRSLRSAPHLLGDVRTAVADLTGAPAPPIRRPARVAARNLLVLVVLAVAVHLLLPQVAMAGETVKALGTFRWTWLPAIGLAGALTYVMAALALMAASGRILAFGRTLAAQLAAAFTNRLAPAGVGAMATNVRYLEATGLARARALTAVALNSMAGLFVHIVAIATVFAVAGASHQRFSIHAPDVPDRWAVLVLVAAVLSSIGLVFGASHLRHRLVPPVRAALAQIAVLVRQPVRALALLGSAAGITTAYALALAAAVQAAGGGPSLVSIFAVYLGGSALAAAAPTPGGLGALEAGLVAGLTAVGMQAGPAVTAVLVFRLVTYWLPVVPGAAAFWALRRAGTL